MNYIKIYLIFAFLGIFSFNSFAQNNKTTISGYVKDIRNGEGLIGVSVYIKELGTGNTTNAYGFYSITVPQGKYNLVFSYIGYNKITKLIEADTESINFNLEMAEEGVILNEVVVSAKKEDDNVKSIEMSVNKISMKTIQKMPALLGEVDLVKSIQLLPGVTTIGEGSSGFNVRGGGVDQNLVLLDEAPVYNSSHLFGFFSVFNPDAVKDVKLIKGGIPAQYGGRISSILDVKMKEGNSKKLEVNGGVGAIFSRISLEAPIFKNKASFIVAARRSYIDVLAKPFLSGEIKDSKFNFYDLTAKLNYKISEKDVVFLSGYFGRDVFGSSFGFNWGNATTSLRWNHVFNNRLFLNTTAYYSNYDYLLATNLKNNNKDSFSWNSNIISYSFKPDFTYYISPNNSLTFGGQAIYYTFKPGLAIAKSAGEERSFGSPNKFGAEISAYVGNELKITPAISVQYGLRYSNFDYLGEGSAYTFEPFVYKANENAQRRKLIDSKYYESGEIIANYGNWEPRFSANINLNSSTSLKMSYNRTAQYLHLMSNTAASTPLDIWTPTTNNIKPQLADQVAFGVFKNFGADQNDFETSIEVYYKKLQNQIDYIDNSDLFLNEYFEGDLLFGKGRAYGAEFFVKKNTGKFNGWVSYTLSRTERQVLGVNANKWFPSRFDRTHVTNIVAMYDLNKRWSFSTNFAFYTGVPYTFPRGKFVYDGFILPDNENSSRNDSRVTNYHRLDLSATLQAKKGLFKKGTANWVFSIYNAYNRRNAFSVYFRQNPDDNTKTEAVKLSIFGSVLPAVTYNFKF
jgi:CarboxypepD_reg-like domain/TonB-dependent Receptor Plug Domain